MHLHTDVARLPDRSRRRAPELNPLFWDSEWLEDSAESLMTEDGTSPRSLRRWRPRGASVSRLAPKIPIPTEKACLGRYLICMHWRLEPHADLISTRLRVRTHGETPCACRAFISRFGAGRQGLAAFARSSSRARDRMLSRDRPVLRFGALNVQPPFRPSAHESRHGRHLTAWRALLSM